MKVSRTLLAVVGVLVGCQSSGSSKPITVDAGAVSDGGSVGTRPDVQLTTADNGKSAPAFVGDIVELTLQTIGPGEYGAPVVSSSAIHFEGMTLAPPNPGGPTQVYRFMCRSAGSAMVTISHTVGKTAFTVTLNVK